MKITKRQLIKRIIITLLCAFILIFCIGSYFSVKFILKRNFGRSDINYFTAFLRLEDIDHMDKYKRVETFYSGKNRMIGYVCGNENGKGLIVMSHDMGGGAESFTSEILYFIEQGYCIFAFDNTGCHNSEGSGMIGMAQSAVDLDAALTYVESNKKLKNLPILLYGHGWGGYAVAAVLESDHDVKASVSIAGYNTPMEILKELSENMIGHTLTDIEYPFIWLNNKITFGKKANISAVDAINSSDAYVMIIHGTGDETVKFDGASIIAHKDEITNSNVVYKEFDGKLNGHNNISMTEEGAEYLKELDKEYDELNKQYNDEIPHEIKKEFYNKIDKNITCKLSEQFMSDINNFYLHALAMSN